MEKEEGGIGGKDIIGKAGHEKTSTRGGGNTDSASPRPPLLEKPKGHMPFKEEEGKRRAANAGWFVRRSMCQNIFRPPSVKPPARAGDAPVNRLPAHSRAGQADGRGLSIPENFRWNNAPACGLERGYRRHPFPCVRRRLRAGGFSGTLQAPAFLGPEGEAAFRLRGQRQSRQFPPRGESASRKDKRPLAAAPRTVPPLRKEVRQALLRTSCRAARPASRPAGGTAFDGFQKI